MADRVSIISEELQKYPVILDLDQVAEILGLNKRTVDKMVKDGIIKAFPLDPTKERKQYRVTKADLMAYLTNNHK